MQWFYAFSSRRIKAMVISCVGLLFATRSTAFTIITRCSPAHQTGCTDGWPSLHLTLTSSLFDSIASSDEVQSLPIYNVIETIQTSHASKQNLLLQAAPGAGKTTIVPLLLPGKTIVVQPRRVATRSAAARMANLLGEPVGQSIGYAIRGESRQSSDTKVLVMTDGVLLNMLQKDPELTGYDTVILDEFHERGVGSDTNLALLREVQSNYREDLKIIVMSATLLGDETENVDRGESMKSKLTRVLGGEESCTILQSEGRQYPISYQYTSSWGSPPIRALVRDTKLLVQTMVEAIEEGVRKAPDKGDVLAFLPGAKEIRMAVKELESRNLDVEVFPLFGALPKADQDRATIKTIGKRRVIVSSPIAEASLTIEGVTCVVDSGLQRQPKYDVNTGLPHLVTVTCSKDSVIQRAGRAGRTRDGHCIRLFSEYEYDNLALHATPEICSTDLVPTTLLLTEWGCTCATEIIEDLPFVDPPPKESLAKAYQMLVDLNALEEYKLSNDNTKRYKVTKLGHQIVSLPTHPRFATAIIKAAEIGEAELAAAIAATALTEDVINGGKDTNLALNVRDVLAESPNSFNGKQLINFASRLNDEAKSAILNAMSSSDRRVAADVSERVGSALLPGFVDLIAQRKGDASFGGSTYMLALGQSARLDEKSDEGDYVIVVDTSTGDDGKTRIRSYCKLDPSTIKNVATEKDEVYTVASKGFEVRKRRVSRVGSLILSSSTLPSPSAEEVTSVLLDTIESIGGISALLTMQSKKDATAMDEVLQRLSLAVQASNDHEWPECFASICAIQNGNYNSDDERMIMAVIEPWLSAVTSLKGLNLLSIFNAQLGPDEQLWLDKHYPTKILAPDGSFVPIDYNSETGPVATAKLQQFFGQVEFPSVGPPGNSTPVTLSLLSPSGKPLAQTIDLSFFWRETYPLVRAEMRGRYPKHPWPEDPLTAAATKMTNKQVMKSSECVQTGQTIECRKSRRKKS
ncbi:hypothetical protein ACHAWO_010276 [Cyclotella atomus]|uniref:ATP-dependent helicase HrpB n=1 Tax=Cyclotella atomus TaxID=382360 RepID=A0ABD3NPK6_9STRA